MENELRNRRRLVAVNDDTKMKGFKEVGAVISRQEVK